jgi:hypothetical protein
MTYSIIDRLKFEHSQQDNLKKQEKLRQEKYEIENKPNDMKHITSCDMTDAYAKVHADNRTHHNNMYLVPPHRYKNKK